jgi:hypothetical protein
MLTTKNHEKDNMCYINSKYYNFIKIENMKIQIIISVVLLFAASICVKAQEAVVTTGGEASSETGSVSYTVGQVVYTTSTGTSGSVAQGVQQPYEIFVATAIPEAKGIDLSMSVYPNPTTNRLTLKVSEYESDNLSYHLFDVTGKLVKMKKITDPETRIIMQDLKPGVYFLRIVDKNKEIKVFKIIKK